MPEPTPTLLSPIERGLNERLICLHDEIKGHHVLRGVNRIAVTLYDERSDILKSFAHSSDGECPFSHLTQRMSDQPVLRQLARTGARRVINDIASTAGRASGHGSLLLASGYLSSYTVPVQHKGTLYGFLFFNSFRAGFFSTRVIQRLRPYAEAIALMVMRELDTVRMMTAAVKVIRQVSSARDEETASHLARMARYAQLIASKLAAGKGLADEFVEFVFQFCPLHDVGKVAVPDSILLKPGNLTDEEVAIMRTHVTSGVKIVDMMIRDFGICSLPHSQMLRNIVGFHHEAIDGSGYPYGLKGLEIPFEARIAAVADVFDALTSKRPYKDAWSNERALDLLRREAGRKLDADCVAIMLENVPAIEDIQSRFGDSATD
ncbi:MAG: HD domain-containing protein [Magnetospirillum sp.]|nr:HD domain-containing protein [Magnetospirillum sp.]